MIFSSLGSRVPKTEEERDKIQEKLSNRPKRNVAAAEIVKVIANGEQTNGVTQPVEAATVVDVEQEEEDTDAWRSKINLFAVECCDENVTYSTPPFPFYQWWDHNHAKHYKNKRKAGKHKEPFMANKRQKQRQMKELFLETYDKYNVNGGGGDALDYDDAKDEEEDDEYWEEGALLGDSMVESEDEDDGFPALPADPDTCAALPESDAQVNDFITYTELACDEGTNWQPLTVNRLAKIVECKDFNGGGGGKTWVLQMSSQDRKAKVFDEEGNRVYSKFEMPDDEEEDDEAGDDGLREVRWEELGGVRLVLREGQVVDESVVVDAME